MIKIAIGIILGASAVALAQNLPPTYGTTGYQSPLNLSGWNAPVMLTARRPDGTPWYIQLDGDGMVIANCGPRQ